MELIANWKDFFTKLSLVNKNIYYTKLRENFYKFYSEGTSKFILVLLIDVNPNILFKRLIELYGTNDLKVEERTNIFKSNFIKDLNQLHEKLKTDYPKYYITTDLDIVWKENYPYPIPFFKFHSTAGDVFYTYYTDMRGWETNYIEISSYLYENYPPVEYFDSQYFFKYLLKVHFPTVEISDAQDLPNSLKININKDFLIVPEHYNYQSSFYDILKKHKKS